jgi:hypothetical protein
LITQVPPGELETGVSVKVGLVPESVATVVQSTAVALYGATPPLAVNVCAGAVGLAKLMLAGVTASGVAAMSIEIDSLCPSALRSTITHEPTPFPFGATVNGPLPECGVTVTSVHFPRSIVYGARPPLAVSVSPGALGFGKAK